MIVALLTLWPAITAAQAPSPEERLGAAAAKWSADKPTAYEFTLRLVCFCPVLALSREPIVFRVEDGKPSFVSGESVVAKAFGSPTGMDKYATVERQFDFIRLELAKRHYRMEVQYDQNLGFPTLIAIDPERNVADDEITLRIEGFRVLVR